jgi:cardiolipin synthase
VSHANPLLRDGHEVQLLEGSVEYFPALIATIGAARHRVRLETYIFDLTGSGADIAQALMGAARRGVNVQVVVDGYGTGAIPYPWPERLAAAGVQWAVYSPPGTLGLLVPGRWRRLHRKLCVVDGDTAFCGGINILDDFHDPNHGGLAAPRFDFAVRVRGPLVAEADDTMGVLWQRMQAARRLRARQLAGALESLREAPAAASPRVADPADTLARAALVLRDNVRHRSRIERAYRRAISTARSEVIIANAYFVPGRKMRKALIRAAQRGVRVQLLLQGRYEYFMQYYSSRPVYGALLQAGVEIHEYSPSFLHAKVAVVDGQWATVGSSNLDPLSMLLAREANVVVDDAGFAGALRERLLRAMREAGTRMDPAEFANRSLRERAFEWLALGLMRLALLVHGKEYL